MYVGLPAPAGAFGKRHSNSDVRRADREFAGGAVDRPQADQSLALLPEHVLSRLGQSGRSGSPSEKTQARQVAPSRPRSNRRAPARPPAFSATREILDAAAQARDTRLSQSMSLWRQLKGRTGLGMSLNKEGKLISNWG